MPILRSFSNLPGFASKIKSSLSSQAGHHCFHPGGACRSILTCENSGTRFEALANLKIAPTDFSRSPDDLVGAQDDPVGAAVIRCGRTAGPPELPALAL